MARERAAWLRSRFGAEIVWRPYHLHPEYPPDGISREVLAARYGDHFQTGVRQLAEDAGLRFNPHPQRVPNTRRALELGEWARETAGEQAHERLHDRVMDAYWVEGRDITGWDELAGCVRDVGLDADQAIAAVDGGDFAEPVDAWTSWAHRHGITAVPAFIIDERLLVSGAVPHEHLEAGVVRARELRAESPPDG